jgi:hypothetical protein
MHDKPSPAQPGALAVQAQLALPALQAVESSPQPAINKATSKSRTRDISSTQIEIEIERGDGKYFDMLRAQCRL